MPEKNEQAPGAIAPLTYADTSNIDDFFLPPETDEWGVKRTPFSPHLARISAELSADGYDVNIRHWQETGWLDCTFVIENRIVPLDKDGDSRISTLENIMQHRKARSLMRGANPVSDLFRAIRQLMVTDLGKSIVLTRVREDGKTVIAISFIGTTQKYYDWFSNFKLHQQTGMHHGFLELAKSFDAQTAQILLPHLALARGEESFTLADAIQDAAKPESNTVIWLCGHSQGGALCQTYAHLLMKQGVPCWRIHAYTFAAPSVATSEAGVDPKAYPVYNIVNADDMVPRIGAEVRLGMDFVYFPDEAFRGRHYRVDETQKAAFTAALFEERQIQSTREGLCWLIAMMRLMKQQSTDEALAEFFGTLFPYRAMLKRLEITLSEVGDFLEGKFTAQFRELTDGPLPEERCDAYAERMQWLLRQYGAKKLSRALLSTLGAPHRLRPDKHDEDYESPYIAIVRRHLSLCERGVWQADPPIECVSASGKVLLPIRRVSLLALSATPTAMLPEQSSTEKEDPVDEKTL